jgi:hypothetical protein
MHDQEFEYPSLLSNAETGPPDARRGHLCLAAWLHGGAGAHEQRPYTSEADIDAELTRHPELYERLRRNPGPYAQFVAIHNRENTSAAVDHLLRTKGVEDVVQPRDNDF